VKLGRNHYISDWAQQRVQGIQGSTTHGRRQRFIQPAEYRLLTDIVIDHQERIWRPPISVTCAEVMVYTAVWWLLTSLGATASLHTVHYRMCPALLAFFFLLSVLQYFCLIGI
jgi:hypothetical protein